MNSSPIEDLKALQEIDTELLGVRRRQKAGPREREQRLAERDTLQKQLAAKKIELQNAQIQADELDLQVKNCDKEIEDHKEKLRQVTNNREYTAARSSIDSANERRSQIETQALEQMERVELLQKEVGRLEEKIREIDGVIANLDVDIAKESEELQKQVESIRERRNACKEKIDPEALSTYEMVIRSNAGTAVVEVIDGACQGCFRQLSPNLASKASVGKELVRCDSCGRFLFTRARPEEEPSAEA